MTEFSHLTLWSSPLASLCFFSLMMTVLSFWLHRSFWLWGAFLAISYFLAYQTKIVSLQSLFSIIPLFLLHWFLKEPISGLKRAFLVIAAIGLSLGLMAHVMPGFHNWKIVSGMKISPDSVSYSFFMNYDKPFIGIFVLAFGLPLIQSKAAFKQVLKKSVILSALAVVILLALSFLLKIVAWDPKVPTIFFLWMLSNLFLVSIPEEAFWRGFVQKELFHWWGKTAFASIGAVVVTALFFALMHLFWVPSVAFIATVFVAGCFYGAVYQYTQSIESSIFCHFLVNLTHFLFFSYPALQSAIHGNG